MEHFREEPPVENSKEKTTPSLERLEGILKKLFGKIEVSGLENLKDLEGGEEQVILAVSHLSDYDQPIALATLGKLFNIKFTYYSALLDRPIDRWIINRYEGLDKNGIPIDYSRSKKRRAGGVLPGKRVPKFNTADYEPMKDALDQGHAVMVAAQKATYDGQLDEKPGIAVPYLAMTAHKKSAIVPVAIDIQVEIGKTSFERLTPKLLIKKPNVRVSIGKPIKINPLTDPNKFRGEIMPLGNKVVSSLAEMLPEKKRGEWGKPETIQAASAVKSENEEP